MVTFHSSVADYSPDTSFRTLEDKRVGMEGRVKALVRFGEQSKTLLDRSLWISIINIMDITSSLIFPSANMYPKAANYSMQSWVEPCSRICLEGRA